MIEVFVLGPLEVRRDGEVVALPGGKPRVLLAALVVHANDAVSQDRLIDALWGEPPPARAGANLHVHVATLRKLLGGAAIETTSGGYRLRIDPERVDASRFERLLRETRGRDDAADRLRDALALWRGPAFADVADEPFAHTESMRLEELRLSAVEERLEADLALGRHRELVPELESLVTDHPLRERLAGQLMRTLYASGRQAEALAVYRDLRRRLVEQLGIEPSPELHQVERGILQQDAALTPPTQPRPKRRRRLVVALGTMLALVLAGVISAAVIVPGGSSKPPPPPVVKANSLVELDPETGRVVSVTPVGDTPVSLTATPGAVWVVNRGDRTVTRVDTKSHATRTIGGVSFANDIAADGHANVWVSGLSTHAVARISDGTSAYPTQASRPPTITVPKSAGALAVGAGYLWVTDGVVDDTGWLGSTVSLVDLRSRRVVASLPAGPTPIAVQTGYGSAWIANYAETASVSVIRPGSPRDVIPIDVHRDGTPLSIAVGEESVWALTFGGTVFRIDPDTRRIVNRIVLDKPPLQPEPLMISVGAGYVWVTARDDFAVLKIDPRTNKVAGRFTIGNIDAVPCGVRATDDAVWVTIASDTRCGWRSY